MAQKAEDVAAIRRVTNWIDGKPQRSASNRWGDVYDSATGEKCASVVMSTEGDVDAAVAAAAAAFPSWSRTPVQTMDSPGFRMRSEG